MGLPDPAANHARDLEARAGEELRAADPGGDFLWREFLHRISPALIVDARCATAGVCCSCATSARMSKIAVSSDDRSTIAPAAICAVMDRCRSNAIFSLALMAAG